MQSNLGNIFAILEEWRKTDDVSSTLTAFGEIMEQLYPLRESLTEILKAEEQNYDTAKAMPTPNREVDKGDLLSRSWGRITLLRDLLGIATSSQEEMASPDTESEPKKTIGKEATLKTSWTRPLKGAEAGLRLDSEASLTCDKSKEPPCHLEPSTELCSKCSLNNQKEIGEKK